MGAEGDDDLNGGQGADTLEGDAGNDLLQGKEGDDSLVGGADDDVLEGGRGDDTLDGGAGNDTLTGGDRGDLMLGGDGDDSLKGNRGPDTMSGGEGNDTLSGAEGTDSLTGDGGDDSMAGGAQADTLKGGDGDDSMRGNEGADSMEGGADNDTLIGDRGNDTLYGNDGDDSLGGGQGADFMIGEAGNDTMLGAEGSDFMQGGDGDDSLSGGGGDDFLQGGSGNDTLIGGDGNDFLSNTWDSSSDTALLKGGAGGDTLSVDLGLGLLEELVDAIAAGSSENGQVQASTVQTAAIDLEAIFIAGDPNDQFRDALLTGKFASFVIDQMLDYFEAWYGSGATVETEYVYRFDPLMTGEDLLQEINFGFSDQQSGADLAVGTLRTWLEATSLDEIELDTNASNTTFNFDLTDVELDLQVAYDAIEQAVTFQALNDPAAVDIITYAGGTPSFPGYWNVGLGSGADIVQIDLDIPIGAFDLDAGDGDDQVTVSGTNASIDLGDGDDLFFGGAGGQMIIDGAGSDVVDGGEDDDAFYFVLDGVNDEIRNYEAGEMIVIEDAAANVSITSNLANGLTYTLTFDLLGGGSEDLMVQTDDVTITEADIEDAILFVPVADFF